MEALGLNFSKKFEIQIVIYVCMFYSHLNIVQIRIFEKVESSQICYDFKSLRLFQELRGFQNREIHIQGKKCTLEFQKLGISDLLRVRTM